VTSPFIEVASDLALEAGRRIMILGKSPLIRQSKPDHSLVTNADHEADRILREGLRKAFPDHAILTEESGLEGSVKAEYMWVVDPLDGTRAFAKGVSGYSVMVGLLKEGKPRAGVVYDPLEDHLYDALQGAGTFHTHEGIRTQVHVSTRRDLSQMPVITSTGFPKSLDGPLRKELPGPWIPAVNSVGVKVGFIVRRLADIYISHHLVHYWDTCAPQIILEEAGGLFTLADGSSLSYDLQSDFRHSSWTLATNRTCHSDLLQLLRRFTPPLV
jgi:3'(2'), 5'-bisphosphate nucleotidase